MMFQSNHECRSNWDISSLEAVYKAIHKFSLYEVKHLWRVIYNRFRKAKDGKVEKYTGKTLGSAKKRASFDHQSPARPSCFSTEENEPLRCWIIFQEEDPKLLVQLERITYCAYGGPLTLLNGEVPKSAALSQHADAIGFDFLQPNGRLLKIRHHKDARKCRLNVSISPMKTNEEYCFRFAQPDHDGGTLNPGDLVTITYTLQAAQDGEVHLVFEVKRLNQTDSW